MYCPSQSSYRYNKWKSFLLLSCLNFDVALEHSLATAEIEFVLTFSIVFWLSLTRFDFAEYFILIFFFFNEKDGHDFVHLVVSTLTVVSKTMSIRHSSSLMPSFVSV